MLRCSDNSLYTGITNDFEKRFKAHMTKDKVAAKYTKSRDVVCAEALWSCDDKSGALRLECYIKRLNKKRKEELIKNPESVNDSDLTTEYKIIKNFA